MVYKVFCLKNSTLLQYHDAPLFVSRTQTTKNKVALVSGGGSGHEPLHIGFIGQGMLTAVCPGQVFTSPTPEQILAALDTVATDMGALLIVKNYHGDKMNFSLACAMTTCDVETVIINDDASFADVGNARGIAGVVIVEKIVGAGR